MGERHSPRLLQLHLDSSSASDLFPFVDVEPGKTRGYDISVEGAFLGVPPLSHGVGVMREPERLEAGHVDVPDFSFEKDTMTVFLEIVGFWTEEYLRR